MALEEDIKLYRYYSGKKVAATGHDGYWKVIGFIKGSAIVIPFDATLESDTEGRFIPWEYLEVK